MILRIRVDFNQRQMIPVFCSDDGKELFELDTKYLQPGDVLDINLPDTDPWKYIVMT